MNKKILMVDDSNSTIELVKTYIEEYEVLGASCGKDMWEALGESTPELILLDIVMPGEDGFQLANDLSRDEKYCDIPIIFISAKNTGRDVMEGLKCDVYDYIKKPFDRFELLARINAVIKRKELENKLKDQSVRDSLTNCFNRKYFYDQVKQQVSLYVRTGTTFSIALIDIDNFKHVNDTYGHLAGDDVITKFASLIKENIRLYDIPIRFGGEEFAVIFPSCIKMDAAKAIIKIKNILQASPPVYNKNKISFTFSCGIVEVVEIKDKAIINFESLIKIADDRLYNGKNSGKDTIITE